MKYYLVQLVASSGGYMPDYLYLARASSLAKLDAEGKRRVANTLGAGGYVHRAGPTDEQVSDLIHLADGDSIRLGADLTYDADLAKIDWSAAAR